MLAFANMAYGQVPTDYTITHHLASNPTGGSITTPYTFPKNSPAVQCNQPKIAITGIQVNPRYYRWDDPEVPTADCVFDKTLATTPLFTDPPPGGDYVARMAALVKLGSATLTSELSDPSNPFVRGTIPPVVLHLRVRGQ